MTLLWLTSRALAADPVPPPVVGGELAEIGAWPDIVSVHVGGSSSCTGVLIAPEWVLTAAHCNVGVTSVQIGTVDYQDEAQGELIAVVDSASHPNSWNTSDVAVLKLAEPATIAPRLLARDCIVDGWLFNGGDATVVGFGAHDSWGAEKDGLLRSASVPIVDAICEDLERGCNQQVSPGGELIAGGEGVDSCTGDSGGPLYLQTELGNFVVGITSRAAMPSSEPCGDGGIYARVDAVADWIESTTGEVLPRPVCQEGYNYAPTGTAAAIVVDQGLIGTTVVQVHDPNANDWHTFAVTQQPDDGFLQVNSQGVGVFFPEPSFIGPDLAVVTVTDSGDTARDAEVSIPITVNAVPDTLDDEEVELPSGCSSTPRHLGVLPLLPLLLLRRRE